MRDWTGTQKRTKDTHGKESLTQTSKTLMDFQNENRTACETLHRMSSGSRFGVSDLPRLPGCRRKFVYLGDSNLSDSISVMRSLKRVRPFA